MINEEIKKLLDSELEDDNNLGWELIKAKKIPYEDVVDYVESAKVPTQWSQRYIWQNNKFVKNPYISAVLGLSGDTLSVTSTGTGLTWPSRHGTTSTPTFSVGSGTSTYTSSYPSKWRINSWETESSWKEEYKKQRDAEIQKEKELDKPRGLWANIKHAFK